MSRLDHITGKWRCKVVVYDLDESILDIPLISVASGPVFSTERDADLAEELAEVVYAQAQLKFEDRTLDD
jgi:Glu-tRNA(Gln) amidotransferase subunit E-like FAD-binding protein